MPGSELEILLVEDNPRDVELTLLAFEAAQIASRVQVARDGAEALDYVFGRSVHVGRMAWDPPNLILLDLKLPPIDGIEVLRQIKADPQTRSIPVVVLTSSAQDVDVKTCYALGVNSYIVKPIDFAQFTEVIRVLQIYWLRINRPPPEEPTRRRRPASRGDCTPSSVLDTP